jgi:hypothetical protein
MVATGRFAGARLRGAAGAAAGRAGFRVRSTENVSAMALDFMSRVVIP